MTDVQRIRPGIHGVAEVVWEALELPDMFWRKVVRHGPHDCWLWGGDNHGTTRRAVVARLLRIKPVSSLGHVHPTCGNLACVNPQHQCLSLKRED